MRERQGHLDEELAERLLAGDASARAESPLGELLMRASAPGRPGELAGEEQAVAAFRAARRRKFSWRRLLTFKFFGAFLAMVAAGGLAFASSTAVPPATVRADPPAPTRDRSQPATPPVPLSTPADAEAKEAAGLCHAYLEKVGEDRGKALQSKAFARLVEAAGGAERVESYCRESPGEKAGKDKDKDKDMGSDKDKGKPSKAPQRAG